MLKVKLMPRTPIPKAVKAIVLHMREMGYKVQEISERIGISTGKTNEISRSKETCEDEEVELWLGCFRSAKIDPWPPEFIREKYCAYCETSYFCLDEETRREYEERFPEIRGKIMDCHGAPAIAYVHVLWTKRVASRASVSNSSKRNSEKLC